MAAHTILKADPVIRCWGNVTTDMDILAAIAGFGPLSSIDAK